MPIRMNAITNDSQNPELLANLVQVELQQRVKEAFATPDKAYFVCRSDMIDSITGEPFGHYVFTLHSDQEKRVNEILDIDITLDNPVPTSLSFLNMLPGSSDSNEYYNAETEDGSRLQIETVGRYTVEGTLAGTTREVSVSVFPFQLTVFNNMRAFNVFAGFEKPIQVGGTDYKVDGMSPTFMSPGGVFSANQSDEAYTFMLGTVESYHDVQVDLGEKKLDFVLAQVSTALGVVPVAMGRDVFDLSNLREGCVLAMNADVKADLAKESDYRQG